MIRASLKVLVAACAVLLFSSSASASEVGSYPNATTPLSGTERLLGDQSSSTVNITPAQLDAWFLTQLTFSNVTALWSGCSGTTPILSYTGACVAPSGGSGTAPTIAGCGTPTPAAGSGANAGHFTAGATSCNPTLTFGTTATNWWICWLNDETTNISFRQTGHSPTTSVQTASGSATTSDTIDYVCSVH